MALHRNVDVSKQESELAINIRKATSVDETAPKRKHVRSCIVYTWDHKTSQSFWAGMKVQPILADEVQTFKALITIHKVLQEGHPIVLKEAQANVGWLESLRRGVVNGEGVRGYGKLIEEYIYFLRAKLAFHRQHTEFNGTFEYEEYVSLKSTNDPNEGYETISDLMTLQDQIDSFQKLIFAHIPHTAHSECRISALVPLVQESYGIYKFITSMLRAMHTSLDDDNVLEPLRSRYDMQHYRLAKFYYECSQLRYLTSLITVPKLPHDPPNLFAEDDERPSLPSRPAKEIEKPPTPERLPSVDPEPINEFWKNQSALEDEQRRLQAQLESDRQRQDELDRQARLDFERQQASQAEQQRMEQERLQQQLQAQQTIGRMAELERENLAARARYDQDQLMLSEYDRKVRALEAELGQLQANYGQQSSSKDEQIRLLQEQVNTWRNKYEALAKLYSQLRTEHLELLNKFKGVQVKAASAQEAIDQRERLQRELKQKNLDLANMLRERDRALLDKDRVSGGHKDELEKLQRELRFAREQADNAERSKGSELSALVNRYNRELADLEESARQKDRELKELREKLGNFDADLSAELLKRDEEIEILRAGFDQSLQDLDAMRARHNAHDQAFDGSLAAVMADNERKLFDIVDSVLQSGVRRVDDSLYELESSNQAGNQNATGAFVLSQIERAGQNAMEFSTSFRDFIADGSKYEHSEIIRTVNIFAGSIADVLSNTKGLTRFASDERKGDQLVNGAKKAAQNTIKFFRELQSFRLEGLEVDQKQDVIIHNNGEVQLSLQNLSKLADAFAPKSKFTSQSGDLGELVDRELSKAADAISAAASRLEKLRNKPRDSYSTYELKINDSILDAALAITNAIAQLIKAATDSQKEIVNQGKGTSSTAAFYKKHNRWTEGLISAAKAVATSTNLLIETADGVISGRKTAEELIVASNEVAASTAQLVAASRVKASLMSKTQDRLETASKEVTKACRSLVRQVQEIIAQRDREDGDAVDYSALTTHELKTSEFQQQVEILKLETELSQARTRLGDMRKLAYQDE